MALSKAKKAILKAKFGGELYGLLIQAEDVIVTESGGEVSLAEKLAAMLESIEGKATTAALSELSGKVSTLTGDDTGLSARQIASQVLAAAGKLEYTIVESVSEINPEEEGADEYIYLVPKTSGKENDGYDEYMVIEGEVEKVGDWDVDLSNYVQKASGVETGEIAVFKTDGSIQGSGKKLSDIKEYSAEEQAKVAASKEVTDKLKDNADTLADISAEDVAAWNGKGTVYVSKDQPSTLQNGDLWLQIFDEG